MSRPLLTVREVAERLRCKPDPVLAAIRAKKLRATKPGRTWLISEEALAEYLAANENTRDAA